MKTTRQQLQAVLMLVTATFWTMATGATRAMAAPAPLEPDRRPTVPPAATGGFPWWHAVSVGMVCVLLAVLVALAVTRVTAGRRRGRRPATA